jgi:hypothetical protein
MWPMVGGQSTSASFCWVPHPESRPNTLDLEAYQGMTPFFMHLVCPSSISPGFVRQFEEHKSLL